jgi:hypothetical protein
MHCRCCYHCRYYWICPQACVHAAGVAAIQIVFLALSRIAYTRYQELVGRWSAKLSMASQNSVESVVHLAAILFGRSRLRARLAPPRSAAIMELGNSAEGWSRDVSAEIAAELRKRCDLHLHYVPPSLKDFIDRHDPVERSQLACRYPPLEGAVHPVPGLRLGVRGASWPAMVGTSRL